MATADQRTHIYSLQNWLVSQASHISYLQLRPMVTAKYYEHDLVTLFREGISIAPDCSEMQTMVCRMCGLKDPNGLNYNGLGFTGDMKSHLPNYTDATKAQTGALCVFGAGTGVHVAGVHDGGVNPRMFNHGDKEGPHWVMFNDLRASFSTNFPYVFLDISNL